MNNVIINEQQLLSEIDQLRGQFTETQDLYREVCVLLFFRYGITPTANKLYQYVRKGSMSAPADALNKFWLELREKSRVRIERTDIPENIRLAAGDFVATLWNEAQKAAQAGFADLVDNATSEILKFKLETEIAKQDVAKIHQDLNETLDKLGNAINKITEAEKIHAVDTSTLVAQEKSLKSLQNERDSLSASLVNTKSSFSKDLEVINASLHKAEDRYRSLEKKTLLEVDHARQQVLKLEKEVLILRKVIKDEQAIYLKDLTLKQNLIANLNERLGNASGKLSEVNRQFRSTSSKLISIQKKYQSLVSKSGTKDTL